MAEWHHLYDPVNDIHYTNGGYIMPNSPVPVDGLEWRAGVAEEPAGKLEVKRPQDQASDLLRSLPTAMRAKYYKDIVLIRDAINDNDWEVVPVLLAAIEPETPEEVAAFNQINEVLGHGG